MVKNVQEKTCTAVEQIRVQSVDKAVKRGISQQDLKVYNSQATNPLYYHLAQV